MNISQYTGQLYPNETLLKPTKVAEEPRTAQAVVNTGATTGTTTGATTGTDGSNASGLGTQIFDTLIETVNPLQHIPGVSTVYRAVTGDTINPIADMAGGWLYGGPVGLAAGAANSFLELVTGKSLAANAMALFSDSSSGSNSNGDVKTTSIGDGSPMLKPEQSLGLKQYQAFAQTMKAKHKGTGATDTNVAWSTTAWTTQALRQATGAYEANQNQLPNARKHANRVA